MAGVRRFADLECYKLAAQVRREILRLTRPPSVRADFRYLHQIRDAARSAPRNIAEGYSRFNPAEIRPYLSTAKASLDEVRDELRDGLEAGYFSEADCDLVLGLIARALGATMRLIQYLDSPAARRFYEHHRSSGRTRDFVRREQKNTKPSEP